MKRSKKTGNWSFTDEEVLDICIALGNSYMYTYQLNCKMVAKEQLSMLENIRNIAKEQNVEKWSVDISYK